MSDERQVWAIPIAEQCHALLEVSESIAAHRDLPTLFRDLAQRLPRIAPFDFIGLVLHNSDHPSIRNAQAWYFPAALAFTNLDTHPSVYGFTRFWPSVWTVVSMGISVWLLAIALKSIPVGMGYAI